MRSYKIYGKNNGQDEVYITTVSSPGQGKKIHAEMKQSGFEYIRCRDCLGGLRFEFNLTTGRKTA